MALIKPIRNAPRIQLPQDLVETKKRVFWTRIWPIQRLLMTNWWIGKFFSFSYKSSANTSPGGIEGLVGQGRSRTKTSIQRARDRRLFLRLHCHVYILYESNTGVNKTLSIGLLTESNMNLRHKTSRAWRNCPTRVGVTSAVRSMLVAPRRGRGGWLLGTDNTRSHFWSECA